MTLDPDDALREIRRENEALNEQVKLLVQTEQQLYRSQNQLDAQLDRIRALAGFALKISDGDSIGVILGRALEILWREFALDWCGVVTLDPGPTIRVVRVPEDHPSETRAIPVDDDMRAWLLAQTGPSIAADLPADSEAAPARIARQLAPESSTRQAPAALTQVSCSPLRRVDGSRGGWLLTISFRRRIASLAAGALAEEHLPFLQLLANHLDHAIANTLLNEYLREQSHELANSLETIERTQSDLMQAQKMEAVGQLAGGVAHDFNNLLTVILGYAGAVANSLPTDSPQYGNVQRVIEAAKRAAGITSQLLSLGRRQVMRREVFDLSEQIQQSTDLLRRLVGEQINVVLEVDRNLPWVLADRSQVEQVLLNLVVNARDAMPEGGTMRIETCAATTVNVVPADATFAPNQFVALRVSDTGIGMDTPTLARIFEPFYTTKSLGKGTGLGLAVVYGAVKQSEGHVLVESEPGQGSRFTVLLPIAPQDRRKGQTVAPAMVALPQGHDRGILLVEDEEAIRQVVSTMLSASGYRVLEAPDGVEALALLDAGARVDLVLTDVMMPRMGGTQLAVELARRTPVIPVVYMSGYPEDLLSAGALTERRRAFIAKPFTADELLAFIAKQFERGTHH